MSERLYKTIDSKLFKSLDIKTARSYRFEKTSMDKTNKFYEIIKKKEGKDKFYSLAETSKSEVWDKSLDEVYLNLKVQISNCNLLFGNKGVAYEDTVIGVGMVWHAENSRIKRCLKLGTISNNGNLVSFEKDNIKLDNLNSTINFSLLFYVAKAGHEGKEKSFGNEEGLIIGEYFFLCLVGEGKGSIFPIFSAVLDKEVLWKYECKYSNIAEDEFSDDNIRVILNSNHKLYKYYSMNNVEYNADLLNSLLAHIITILIMEIRAQEGGKIDLNEESNRGSILSVLKYYNDVLNIRINASYADLLESVQKYIYGCKLWNMNF